MFGLCAFGFYRAFRKGESLESKLLGWPIFKVSYTAVFIQLVVGAILMAIASICPARWAIIAELIVVAAAGFCFVAEDAVREVVTHTEAVIEDKTAAWKMIRSKVTAMAAQTNHADICKLAETIRLADPTPTSMDGKIAAVIELLDGTTDDATIQKAFQLMEQRRVLAKLEK